MKKSHFVLILLSITLIISLVSCNKAENKTYKEEGEIKEFFTDMHFSQDSILSIDQKELLHLLQSVIVKNMTVENNHFKFKLTKEEFKEKGIPSKIMTFYK